VKPSRAWDPLTQVLAALMVLVCGSAPSSPIGARTFPSASCQQISQQTSRQASSLAFSVVGQIVLGVAAPRGRGHALVEIGQISGAIQTRSPGTCFHGFWGA